MARQVAGGYYSYSSSGFDGFGDFGDLGDIFSSFFGGSGFGRSTNRRTGPRKGRDLKYNMDISFEESFLGVTKEISINREETCDTCNGSRAKPGTHVETCKSCRRNRNNQADCKYNTSDKCKQLRHVQYVMEKEK